MAPQPPPSPPGPPADLAEQARLHLESLRAAGVEWLGPPDPAAHPSHSPHVEAGQEPGVAADPPPAPPDPPAAGPPGTLFGEPDIAAASPALSPEQRRQELAVLAETVSGCRRCPALAATRTQTVFGVGPPDAELCFVGEAPGADEDRQGEPFVGAAGQFLNRIIAACGMRREEVYICNILRCRPPGNRTPLPDECANCREYLERQLELVRPKFICALGRVAIQNLIGTTAPLGKLRGRFFDYRGIPVTCTYHPAALLRNPQWKKDTWEDMKKLLARMGRPVPKSGSGRG